MPVTTEDQSIETQLALMNQMWEQHTHQDMEQFDLLSTQLAVLDGKMDSLLLREAERKGEDKATKKFAGYISTFISLAIGAISLILGTYVGG
jgi:hypothetical protein